MSYVLIWPAQPTGKKENHQDQQRNIHKPATIPRRWQPR